MGQRQAALAALWSGIERRPRSLVYYFDAAVLLREDGALQQAVELLDLAAERIPAAASEIDHLRLELLLAERCWSAAREQAAGILAVRPSDIRALDALSMAEFQIGDLRAAVTATQRLVAAAPRLMDYPLRLAMLYRETGQIGRAVDIYEALLGHAQEPDVAATALDALAAIDAAQIPVALVLASESAAFHKSLMQDPVGAARERGFNFSHDGLSQLLSVLAAADHQPSGRTPRH
jgi:tetratricopeptide (TPR) repeat protein